MELSLAALSEKYDRLPEENIQCVNMGITGMGTPNVAIVKSDSVESVVFKAERHHTYCVHVYGNYNRLVATSLSTFPVSNMLIGKLFRYPIVDNRVVNKKCSFMVYADENTEYIMTYLCYQNISELEVAVFDLGIDPFTLHEGNCIDLRAILSYKNVYMYGTENSINAHKIAYLDGVISVRSDKPDCNLLERILNERCVVILTDENISIVRQQFLKFRQNRECIVVHANMLMSHIRVSFALLKAIECSRFIDMGSNSITISLDDSDKSDKGQIEIFSGIYNSEITVGSIRVFDSFNLFMEGSCAKVVIGNNTTFAGVYIRCSFDSSVTIGNDCMMSNGISIIQPDQHCIFDLETGKRRNMFKNISIGNHVWVGKGVSIMGGAVIPDNCILGAHTVTSGKFTEKNCILAGNPARVIRKNIVWARDYQGNRYEDYSECYDQDAMKYI